VGASCVLKILSLFRGLMKMQLFSFPFLSLLPMAAVRRGLQQVSVLWMGSLVGSGSVFFINILMARNLGVSDFGVFGSIYAMATFLSIVASFGISQFWLKVFGKEGWEAVRWVKPSVIVQASMIIVSLIILFVWSFFGPHDSVTRVVLLVMSGFVFGQIAIELVYAKLQLEERYTSLAFWQILPNLLRLIFIAYLFYGLEYTFSIIDVAFIYSLSGIFFAVLGFLKIRRFMKGDLDLKGHSKLASPVLRSMPLSNTRNVIHEVWPFGLAAILAFIYMQIDIVMLRYMGGEVQAGYYNIAYIVVAASMIFPNVLYQKFFLPKYHRWINSDRDKLYGVYCFGVKAMLLMGLAIVFFILSMSWFFIPFMFGVEYEKSILLVNVLSMAIPIYFLAYNSGAVLITGDNIRVKVLIMAVVAVINIILNSMLIPQYQALGAAIATLLSYSLLLFLYEYTARNKVFINK